MKALRIALLITFLFTQVVDATQLIPSKKFQHEGGLNSRNVDTALEETQASDLLNVYFDRGAVVHRGGYSLDTTYSDDVTGMFIYSLTNTTAYSRTTLDKWFITVEGGTIWANDGTNEYEIYDNWTSDKLCQFVVMNNQCFIADDGTNDLLVYDEYAPLINRCETVQAWSAGTDVAGLALQQTGENEGDGCIEWDKTGTTSVLSYVTFTLVTTQDWTNYEDGLVTLNLYDQGDIGTTVLFAYGTDVSNYYGVTNVTSRTSSAWNVLDFSFASPDVTGTPVISTVKWMAVGIYVDAATSTYADCMVDAIELHCARPAGLTATGTLTPTISATAGNVDDGVHYYKTTFYSNSGAHESNMGTASSSVTATAASHGQVNLSAIPCSANPWVTKRKIWRTKAGVAVAGPYYLLTTINDNVTTTYADNTADSNLNAIQEGPYSGSEYNDNSAPSKGRYMITHKNRIFLAGNQDNPSYLYYSEYNEPQSWPTLNYYIINTDDNSGITGLGTYLNNPLLFKADSIWALKGSDRFDFELQRVNSSLGCSSGYTIVSAMNYLYFLGHRDVFRFSGSGIEAISNTVRDKLETINDAIVADTAVGINYSLEGQYWLSIPVDSATYNTRTLIYDYDMETWSEYDLDIVTMAKGDFDGNYQFLYWSDTDEKKYIQDYNSAGTEVWLDNATAISARYVTKWYDMETPYQEKEFPYVKIFVENESDVESFNVYWSVDYDSDWIGPIAVDISEGGTITTLIKKVDLNNPSLGMNATGNSIRLKFASTSSEDKFTICGWVIYYREIGGSR